ncbi:MAG TPA: glycosyltransferase family 4 protein [Vicinamibacterales bacterium]|nr:glycosyltransferase family 4 protein [Vicinamibacterales bacterium]
MSILAITSELPWPLDTGGRLRTFHLLTGLARSFDVRLVAGAAEAHPAGACALEHRGIRVLPVPLPPRSAWREGGRVLSAAQRREPYVLYRRHDRPEMRAAIRRAVADRAPDVVYFDHLDSALFAPEVGTARSVVDLHNVYSLIARRASQEHRRWALRTYLRREAELLAGVERRLAPRADLLFSVSEQERRYFRDLGAAQVALVPNGVDCEAFAGFPAGRPDAAPIILYVGAMSWAPNASAATALAEHVLPSVRARIPGARLRIVGKHPPASLRARHGREGVEVLGGVPDVKPHLREAALLAVPLKTGGGTRLKILEAFAAGLPVVSTTVGAEGILCEAGRHLLVAEGDAFADAVVRLLRDRAAGRQMATEARDVVRRLYDWPVVVASAARAIHDAFDSAPVRRSSPGVERPIAPAAAARALGTTFL